MRSKRRRRRRRGIGLKGDVAGHGRRGEIGREKKWSKV